MRLLSRFDIYVLKKFFGTLSFMLILLSSVVLIIDVQSKKPRIVDENKMELSLFLTQYYPYWILYLIMTFMAILVFISIIFFTSRLANNTEIVAYISGGASFHRFCRPYFIGAFILGIFTLGMNHYILPWSNIKKNILEPYTYNKRDKEAALGNIPVTFQPDKDSYLFIQSFNKKEKTGNSFVYQKFTKKKFLYYQIKSSYVRWDEEKKNFVLSQFFEKNILPDGTEKLSTGMEKKLNLPVEFTQLSPDALSVQTKTTPELQQMIRRERKAGNTNLNVFLNDLYQRTSMPVAIFILSILAVCISSEKRRGGIGMNLAIGLALAFVFVFSFEALKIISENRVLPPLLAMWLPNIIFLPIAIYLYIRRARQ